jgi:NAD(P)-dependent dehydrogenase (short-subunit alcohol dehydrogenase family)
MPGYSAAKAGLIGLTNSLTDFLGVRGIRINVLAPGTVPTPRTRAEWAHKPGHFEQADSRAALGHVGSPEAIAESLWALACHFPHTTGEVIAADGGQMKHQG